jgi:hypothetical protein
MFGIPQRAYDGVLVYNSELVRILETTRCLHAMHYLGKPGLFLILESEEEGVELFD